MKLLWYSLMQVSAKPLAGGIVRGLRRGREVLGYELRVEGGFT